MKPRRKIETGALGTLLFVFALCIVTPFKNANAQQYGNDQYGNGQYNDNGYIDYQNFYDELSPYGTWYNDPQYGYVWAPRVESGFRPYYTDGYWANTNYGNMWMSQYPWGWAAFHYGRWAFNNLMGWFWIPGNEWGPAWVSWRQGGGYYGWAPMGPGISINLSFGPNYYVPDNYWTFLPYGNLYSQNFYSYYSPRRTTVIIRNTTIINNTYINNRNTYVTGPRRADVERLTGRNIRTYQVNTASRMGQSRVSGSRINVYRPVVNSNNRVGRRAPMPKTVQVAPARSNYGSSTTISRSNAVAPGRNNVQVNRNLINRQEPLRNQATTNNIQNARAKQQQTEVIQRQQAEQRNMPAENINRSYRQPVRNYQSVQQQAPARQTSRTNFQQRSFESQPVRSVQPSRSENIKTSSPAREAQPSRSESFNRSSSETNARSIRR